MSQPSQPFQLSQHSQTFKPYKHTPTIQIIPVTPTIQAIPTVVTSLESYKLYPAQFAYVGEVWTPKCCASVLPLGNSAKNEAFGCQINPNTER